MGFDTKLIADYTEMINHDLDELLITSAAEYEYLKTDLKRLKELANPTSDIALFNKVSLKLKQCFFNDSPSGVNSRPPQKISEHLLHQLADIEHFINCPHEYVKPKLNPLTKQPDKQQYDEDVSEYKRIIALRIASKLQELSSTRDRDIVAYILKQPKFQTNSIYPNTSRVI